METYLKELGLHLLRVTFIMIDFAIFLELDEKNIKYAFEAGLFHDLGKLRIPKEIINKPEKLTFSEMEIMKQHVNYGEEYSSGLDTFSWLAISEHHEDFNGTGYPTGLKGKEISFLGRMLRIVDAYDAIRTKRAYKDSFNFDETISIMLTEMMEKKKFDSDLLNKFIEFLKLRGIDYYYVIADINLQTEHLMYNMKKTNII